MVQRAGHQQISWLLHVGDDCIVIAAQRPKIWHVWWWERRYVGFVWICIVTGCEQWLVVAQLRLPEASKRFRLWTNWAQVAACLVDQRQLKHFVSMCEELNALQTC